MAKGQNVPEGVRYFGHAKAGSKGKYQTQDLGSGPNTTEFISGGASKHQMAKGSAGAIPAGVHKHSGTESYGKVVHKNASHGGPARKAGASATPEGVRKFGTSKP